jgi:hypothetical protein
LIFAILAHANYLRVKNRHFISAKTRSPDYRDIFVIADAQADKYVSRRKPEVL